MNDFSFTKCEQYSKRWIIQTLITQLNTPDSTSNSPDTHIYENPWTSPSNRKRKSSHYQRTIVHLHEPFGHISDSRVILQKCNRYVESGCNIHLPWRDAVDNFPVAVLTVYIVELARTPRNSGGPFFIM